MILGHVRDGFPRVMLVLPGQDGPLSVEFIIDTGFDGDLSLPGHILAHVTANFVGDRPILLANGSRAYQSTYEIVLDWDEGQRVTQVTELANAPLLGVQLMEGKFLQSEMTDGGEVSLDNL